MKIKKVDDKPMVIHTKEKAKIHAHEPKGAKIKGSKSWCGLQGCGKHRKDCCDRKTITGNLQRGQ